MDTTTEHPMCECCIAEQLYAVHPIVGNIRNATQQRIQGGLPARTQRLWRWLVRFYGPRIRLLGAWGDRSHQARKSDHNSGHAVDASPMTKADGDQIARDLVRMANELGLTYVIWYRRIAMKSNGWRWVAYSHAKAMPHTDHVHASVMH